MSRPIIEVRNLSKVYQLGAIGASSLKDEVGRLWDKVRGRHEAQKKGEFCALKEVSFDVQPGEVVGIIGPNGAGKSTLLKILSRITQQTSGEITLRGRVASLLEVGTGFHPDLTGRENVFLNGAILGMTKAEIRRKLDEIVEFAEVGKFVDTPVKRYSSGMYVRLAFAVAAHLDPEILILDEVLAVGDYTFQAKCLNKMRSLVHEGKTILFVSHNLFAIQSFCHSAILLHDGTIHCRGNVGNAIAQYKLIGGSKDSTQGEENLCDTRYVQLRHWRINGSEERTICATGELKLFVEWEFEVKESVTLYFGCSIKSSDGIYIAGLSTYLEGSPQDVSRGIYRGAITLEHLDLPAGNYALAIGILDEEGTPTHAFVPTAASLILDRGMAFDGMVGLPHQWHPPERLPMPSPSYVSASC